MIVVLGSINADVVLRTERLPMPGETIRASDVSVHPGGKGANQATAVAKLGGDVTLIGRVGDDANGRDLREALAHSGVDTSCVTVDQRARTGEAFITVAGSGENTIVTSGGANRSIGASELDRLESVLPRAAMLLVQLEVPMDVVDAAVELASSAGVPVLLDPAPAADISPGTCSRLAWITPNEREAQALTGETDPERAAAVLRDRGVRNVVVTLGAEGCLHVGADAATRIASPEVDAVDTVACGDAFAGALAVRLCEGAGPAEALAFACTAGAVTSTREGAASSLPTRAEVDRRYL